LQLLFQFTQPPFEVGFIVGRYALGRHGAGLGLRGICLRFAGSGPAVVAARRLPQLRPPAALPGRPDGGRSRDNGAQFLCLFLATPPQFVELAAPHLGAHGGQRRSLARSASHQQPSSPSEPSRGYVDLDSTHTFGPVLIGIRKSIAGEMVSDN
jgi:hypothetical protein